MPLDNYVFNGALWSVSFELALDRELWLACSPSTVPAERVSHTRGPQQTPLPTDVARVADHLDLVPRILEFVIHGPGSES